MGSAKKTISYRFDANRNRTLMIDPDGGRTTYAYDALNRITSLINPQGDRTTYAYDAKGRRTVKKLANGTRASFTYDSANRMTTLANLRSDNSVISKFDYKYDNVGNRTEMAEADGSRVTWSYDNTYQLTAEHRTGTVPHRNTFTYDSVGNRLVKNESGSRTTYSYDAANQLETSVDSNGTTTYTFDADGNQQLVQAPNNDRTTTVWDYENKTTLVELPTGIRNTMAYEPDGLRVKLEESTGTKKFIWDDQNYLAEADENDDINVVYTNEPNYYGNLVSQYRKSGVVWSPSYYHYEALGSTRELTDDSETINDTYLYDAWGNVLNSSGTTGNAFQFTGNVGYYFDFDTKNQYIRARIYSTKRGRWLSVDPIAFSSPELNFYSYVSNSMSIHIDPSGLEKSNSCIIEDGIHNLSGRGALVSLRLWGTNVIPGRWMSRFQLIWRTTRDDFSADNCCCCDEVGLIQIVKITPTGVMANPWTPRVWIVDGSIPYPYGVTYESGRVRAPTSGNPCESPSLEIGMVDQPGINPDGLGWGWTSLSSFKQEFETCIVCLSGPEGIKPKGHDHNPEFTVGLSRLITYGCVSWSHEFKKSPAGGTVVRTLNGVSRPRRTVSFDQSNPNSPETSFDSTHMNLKAPSSNFLEAITRYYNPVFDVDIQWGP